MSDRPIEPPPRWWSTVALLAAVMTIAAAWAGYNAWSQQQGRAHSSLDLDGWGHFIDRLQVGGTFGSLFSDPSLWKGPVVPFLFGLCYYLAPHDSSVLVMNAALFGVSAAILCDAFVRLGAGRWVAAAAVLLWVFYLPHTVIFGYYYAEPVLGLLSAALFWLAGRMSARPSVRLAVAMGIVGGLLVLARAPFLLVVLSLPLVLWRHLLGMRLRVLACFAAGFALIYAPWPTRNYLTEHELIPFTTEGGKILFQGTYLPGDDIGMRALRDRADFQEIEAGVAEEVAVLGETLDVLDLVEQDQAQHLADARQRLQQVVGGRVVHLGVFHQVRLQLGDGLLVVVDERGVGGNRQLRGGDLHLHPFPDRR